MLRRQRIGLYIFWPDEFCCVILMQYLLVFIHCSIWPSCCDKVLLF